MGHLLAFLYSCLTFLHTYQGLTSCLGWAQARIECIAAYHAESLVIAGYLYHHLQVAFRNPSPFLLISYTPNFCSRSSLDLNRRRTSSLKKPSNQTRSGKGHPTGFRQ
ncbi:hypothetical protein CPB84DRAFT_614365 [Gymnopilus junonius]|uniref:Secreted protein n=1 Tax=Gymnopilus junonius TaxID=109634 RepID=A0A9P5NU21_GYMJU|nr:hypothetical protein CPB84DRAFT_614365 [Gymnopilus junonius]